VIAALVEPRAVVVEAGEVKPAKSSRGGAAMESCPMFGGVALRDLEREDRNTLSALFSGLSAIPDTSRTLVKISL